MRIKPILFNTPMVQAILEGVKTQTRRLIKPQPLFKNDIIYLHKNGKWYISPDNDMFLESEVKPKYDIGDILYVRETWADDGWDTPSYIYKATDEIWIEDPVKWRPSIHMPKKASRIFFKIKNIRAERIQDISDDDIKSEGIRIGLGGMPYFTLRDAFKSLWDSTVDPYYNGWDRNPYVWVYEFERLDKLKNWSDLENYIKS